MSELIETLRHRQAWRGPLGVVLLAVSENEREVIIAALERADDAIRICEFCGVTTDEPEPGEPGGRSWICGQCWNGKVRDKNFELTGVHEALRKATQERNAALERAGRVETALTTLVEAAGRLPLDSWAEDHRPDSVDGCTHCGWDDISKCVYTAAHDTQQALEAARAALAGEDE